MLKTNTKNIAKLFNTACKNVNFSGVSIDSRDCSNKLFIAIVGKNLNGHNFIENAIANGCSAVVASEKHNFNIPTIQASNTTIALGQIAKYHSQLINPKIIAITGSNGKTTTKNILYNIFSQIAPTLKTAGNFNNHIGVPLTLLNLESQHKFAIIEMGANHLGEIEYLRNIVNPDIACVINTLDAHIGEFGSKENLIQAKCEIFSKNSINIANTNIDYATDTKFGKGGNLDYSYLKDVNLQLLGKHNLENCLAASSCAKILKVTDKIIKQGLVATKPAKNRLELLKINGYQVISDCYNSSPSSTKFALKTLAEFTGIKIVVLGDMAELGDKSSEIHKKIGIYAKSLNIEYLYSVGKLAKNYGFVHFENFDMLVNKLKQHTNSTILLKASRSAKFEDILKKLSLV